MSVLVPLLVGVFAVTQSGPPAGPEQAVLTGTVLDESDGRPVVGAALVLTDAVRGAVTDSLGRYRIRTVPSGPQHVTVRAVGYHERVLHALVPASGTLEINVSLRPHPIPLAGLEVRLPPAVRGLDHEEGVPFPDRSMTAAAVRNHPMLAEPDAFLALGGGEIAIAPEAPAGLHVRGGASDQVAYVLDGVPVLDPFHAAGTFGALNPDALARVDLRSTAPSPALPEALSGVMVAETRAPGPATDVRAAVSTTHARAALSGPLGGGGAGYLLSLRSGFPGFPARPPEASYLGAETGEGLAKLDLPWAGGRLRLLAYDSENEIDAASTASAGSGSEEPARNSFEWGSVSLGGRWSRSVGSGGVDLLAWRSTVDAAARWGGDAEAAPTGFVSERGDLGVQATLERAGEAGATRVGVRFEERRTRFRPSAPLLDGAHDLGDTRIRSVTAFVDRRRPLGARADLDLGISLIAAAGRVHPGPRLALSWRPSPGWTMTAALTRRSQLVQSLRNPESVAGTIFPAEVWVAAHGDRVPVASGRQMVVAAEHRPTPGVRVGLQAYVRSLEGLALAAPGDAGPFGRKPPVHGSGTARGLSMETSVGTRRAVAVATYGWRQVELSHPGGSYRPAYGSRHDVEAGATLFPSATASVRIGFTALLGRRATPLEGAFEWESCNLLDRGCEFGGSPSHPPEGLGSARLPAYLRLDVGARKHWHLRVAGRDALVALHGTLTNLLGRANVLTYGTDPLTGERLAVEMRPRGPLVVGLDWRF